MAESLEPTTKAKLKHILAKDINELTDYDKEFLRARRDYIGAKEQALLGAILNPPDQQLQAEKDRKEAATQAKEEAETKSQKENNPFDQDIDEDEEENEP